MSNLVDSLGLVLAQFCPVKVSTPAGDKLILIAHIVHAESQIDGSVTIYFTNKDQVELNPVEAAEVSAMLERGMMQARLAAIPGGEIIMQKPVNKKH